MSISLETVRTKLAYRLGDAANAIWPAAELDEYIQEGYDNLVDRTGCLWATDVLPDFAFAANTTSAFEEALLTSGMIFSGLAQFNTEFERDLIDNANGPANHTYHWEYNGGYVSTGYPAALLDLPDDFGEMERSTWNTRRIAALRSRELEQMESRYELNRGNVDGYAQDKDGIDRIRKWRVPSAPYVPYSTEEGSSGAFDYSSTDGFESGYFTSVSGEGQFTNSADAPFVSAGDIGPRDHSNAWEVSNGFVAAAPEYEYGILVTITDIVTDTPLGEWGDFVQIPGEHIMGNQWGVIAAIYKETGNMRIEYRREAIPLGSFQNFEIQDRYTVYVRHFAQAKALRREGPGQDLELAAHFMGRYEAGVERMLRRKQAMQYQKQHIIGGRPQISPGRKPLAQLPWQYGKVVR